VDFGPTDEQVQLAEAERSWLNRNDPIPRIRAALDSAPVAIHSAAVAHAAESGLLALLTPDIGGNHLDLAVLTEAHGHAASSLPLADLAIGTWLLSEAGLPEATPAAQGELLVGLARGPMAEASGSVLSLTGSTSAVPMAADMAQFSLAGLTDDGLEYLAVIADPELVTMSTLDLTRSWARLRIDGPVERWITLPTGTFAYVRDALAVHRALDALGAAARLLEMTVAYAGQREQFGVPIGSFQAVKHHCANMAVGVEAGRSALWAAGLTLDDRSAGTRSRAVSAAVAYAKSAASQVAGTALQVHGGIGFTWEHDLHLFLRRIKVDEALDGTITQHRAALVPS
jgi:alkylation response protein AidB-like acyl-CoA dehydrogenase